MTIPMTTHMRLLLTIAIALLSTAVPDAGADEAKRRRVSVAEVNFVRLEVEQVRWHQKLRIRVLDGRGRGLRKSPMTCAIYRAGAEKKTKMAEVVHRPESDGVFVGEYANEHEHVHGSVVSVVYDARMPEPISTWIAFYYH
jgi:hypothetical protein